MIQKGTIVMDVEYLKGKLVRELVLHFGTDARRIDHALEVTRHAEALLEETPEADPEVVLAAAVTHDFGIVEAERLHGSSNGNLQEKYGPALVRPALKRVGLAPGKIRRISAIVARHHSPPRRPGVDYRLLYESDWLVNVYDFPSILKSRERLEAFIAKNFRTPAGVARARSLLLGEEPLFSRMGKVYKLLVDESKRAGKEKPFLLEIADEARRAKPRAKPPRTGRKRPKSSAPVLDLACGTGFHARILAREGYPVTAVDSSESILAEAKALRSEGKIEYQCGDLLQPLETARPAALTLLLGNTLSLFENPKDLRKVLRHAARATRPGGLILCQILNYERLRRIGTVTTTRHGDIGGRETVLTKTLQVTGDDSFLINMSAAQKKERGTGWESFSRATRLVPLAPAALLRAARAADLAEEGRWGDLAKAPYDKETSPDFVALYRVKP